MLDGSVAFLKQLISGKWEEQRHSEALKSRMLSVMKAQIDLIVI